MWRRCAVLLFSAAWLAACGASKASLREARTARYDAPFATVWNAVTEEIHQRFPYVAFEDPVAGTCVTGYVRIENIDDQVADKSQSGATQSGAAPGTTAARPASSQAMYGTGEAKLFRAKVLVKGPPWQVIIDGEAADYKPGLINEGIVPIKHGQADEPPWVEQRINSLVLAVHKRLRKYVLKAPPPEAVATKTYDTTPWANLPDRAATVLIGKVHKAALTRDTVALRPTMIDDFRWGLGADGSADTALALWSADPSKLRQLAHVLEDGCAAEDTTGEVVCPRGGKGESMARFRKVGSDWKFILFLAR